MQLKHDPWGKAGPGGAPWRNPREIGQSFMKSMVCTFKKKSVVEFCFQFALLEGNIKIV